MKKIKLLGLSVLSLSALAALTSCSESFDKDYGDEVTGTDRLTVLANASSKLSEYLNSLKECDFVYETETKEDYVSSTDDDFEMTALCKYDYDNNISYMESTSDYYDDDTSSIKNETFKIQFEETNMYNLIDNTYCPTASLLDPYTVISAGLSGFLELVTLDSSSKYYSKESDNYFLLTIETDDSISQLKLKGDKAVYITESKTDDIEDGLIVVEKKNVNLKAQDVNDFTLVSEIDYE